MWNNFKTNPPTISGRYMVLWFKKRGRNGPRWALSKGRYDTNSGIWELFLDDFGWTADSGVEISYWFQLPEYPPLPYEGERCKYYVRGGCFAQKNAPDCNCQGNLELCKVRNNV